MGQYEVDYSEVTGKRMECLDGCGLCCLCQPEVLPEERAFFRENHRDSMVAGRGPGQQLALALKKGRGSCVFLSDGTRRCGIYANRPTYCRQYPYHLYVGERVRVEANLSCRGLWTGKGADALAEATAAVKAADRRIVSAMSRSKEVYRQFYRNCEEAGVLADQSQLRAAVRDKLMDFTDLGFLSKVMDASVMEPVMTLDGLQSTADPDLAELEAAARESALESMASTDPFNAPVYCDPDLDWNLFMVRDGQVSWNLLTDAGDIVVKDTVAAEGIGLKPLEEGGREVLADYIGVLNERDSFMGYVFSLIDYNGYEDDMANAYYGCLSTTVLDLMWRASMLDHFTGCGMGAAGIREAIVFYDMDRLDAPAIGAFV